MGSLGACPVALFSGESSGRSRSMDFFSSYFRKLTLFFFFKFNSIYKMATMDEKWIFFGPHFRESSIYIFLSRRHSLSVQTSRTRAICNYGVTTSAGKEKKELPFFYLDGAPAKQIFMSEKRNGRSEQVRWNKNCCGFDWLNRNTKRRRECAREGRVKKQKAIDKNETGREWGKLG